MTEYNPYNNDKSKWDSDHRERNERPIINPFGTEIHPHVFNITLLENNKNDSNGLPLNEFELEEGSLEYKILSYIDFWSFPFVTFFFFFFFFFFFIGQSGYNFIFILSFISIYIIVDKNSIVYANLIHKTRQRKDFKTKIRFLCFFFSIPILMANMGLFIWFFFQNRLATPFLVPIIFGLIVFIIALNPSLIRKLVYLIKTSTNFIYRTIKINYWKIKGLVNIKLLSKNRTFQCFHCNNYVELGQEVCNHCGTPIKACSICKLQIKNQEKCVQCNKCFSYSHKRHFDEWSKIDNKCPVCHANIKNTTLYM